MKRYLLFAGVDYYPQGGWEDFIGDFDERPTAETIKSLGRGGDWWHVVDTETWEVTDKAERIWR